MSFSDFIKKGKNQAAAIGTDDLINELENRQIGQNIFPLDVFNDKIKPFVTDLNSKFDVPRSYIGLAMLVAYSTAIGTAYVVKRHDHDSMCLSVWGCVNGISSSGKSLALDMCLEPLNKIQTEIDREWEEKTMGMSDEKIARQSMKTVIYRDAHVPTLIRYIMPANPKGVLKESDEILEWINGMNSLSKKEGTDEQFWLSAWNGRKYTAIRSGNLKVSIPKVFTNIIGGIQPNLLYKLFKNDRGESGFIFRLLFANVETHRIAQPEPGYSMPKAYREIHERCIERLWYDLRVDSPYDDPNECYVSKRAMDLFQDWKTEKIQQINAMTDDKDKNIYSGILGKMAEYAYRFAGILHIVDIAYKDPYDYITEPFPKHTEINIEVMERALKLTDYFYQSAIDIYKRVDTTVNAPYDILFMASLLKSGKSVAQMAKIMYGSEYKKSTMYRHLQKAIREYPKVFGAAQN